MGAWGEQPWDNDTAADWFGSVLTGNPLIATVNQTLREGESEEQYAALWLVAELGRVYVWPINELEETLALAVAAADTILAGEDSEGWLELWENDPAMIASITSLRDTIKSRIKN